MSEKIWSDDAWDDYLYWQTQDKKTLTSSSKKSPTSKVGDELRLIQA
ncbi:MAG: type II toxin-antitoxin system YoeB family toxin [Ruminococcus sp.]|nr:type II toxin-antitoxin system YoeB family toxin [Ruminococcus sp.]